MVLRTAAYICPEFKFYTACTFLDLEQDLVLIDSFCSLSVRSDILDISMPHLTLAFMIRLQLIDI